MKQPRQLPGLACDTCRARKLRCDRREPKCTTCIDTGMACTITTIRSPRGPQRGHLKALQARVAALEISLTQKHARTSSIDSFLELTDDQILGGISREQSPTDISKILADIETQDTYMPLDAFEPYPSSSEICLSSLMREDLDQLYFDRVHVFAPILQQRRYSAWTRAKDKSRSHTCLQHAMWTLGASLSTQFQHLEKSLYSDTKKMLEELENKCTDIRSVEIEQVQAWILIAIYEFLRFNYCHGWMSAGRSFRLVQLMRLYKIDTPNSIHSHGDWIKTEEMRRTFWMAYSLDRFASITNDWPLTLSEQAIMTRLPAPETNFQSGQPILMCFLSEAVGTNHQTLSSSWAECIVVNTIFGRALSHRNQAVVEDICATPSSDFWDRHQCVNAILVQTMQTMVAKYPATSQYVDPMLLFTQMLAKTTVLYLYKTLENAMFETEEELMIRMEYKSLALRAAQELVDLTKTLAQLSFFKVHPFTPVPLYLCARFFKTHKNPDECFNMQLQEIILVLQGLKSVNHLAESFLQLLDLDNEINDDHQQQEFSLNGIDISNSLVCSG
ncbi:Zn2/Cys6 DNA-binding protein [Glarea lozoyensis ATCC 20868]|uniref:Zn2/Cys6 DNA-binding protein n=1 Tax=Glarea lozoyensis (strain ATCC 20868 / MF5171) TaxID=1116229 RepID=S3CQE7_GLAL2|nr:Zn2/Cys6 DNA-binding protein [Glarea lozoyensis ATCC 20868]EPE28687.1 Zn2/Cys6 DNA-binding protein [Glarea lozoyensis ATCC 20868]